MDELVNNILLVLAMDKAEPVPQRALDGGPSLCGLNQVYWPNHYIPSAQSICDKYVFTRFTNRKFVLVNHNLLLQCSCAEAEIIV